MEKLLLGDETQSRDRDTDRDRQRHRQRLSRASCSQQTHRIMDLGSNIRRKLVRARAKATQYRKGQATPNTALRLVISEAKQKLRAYELYINAIAGDMDFKAQWAKNEFNPVIRDIFGALCSRSRGGGGWRRGEIS
ncbi:hypothetical protein PTSG_13034 [Salpingoeca rosetta]|uniref:Uncharacterized protein n=1 Tax=Salpingoeca rosetta (strain ATCC 50818 / BSB-021) TaxID=946362 RepID=F2UR42_SALR5|nr:uncharacterized protein PTSG_13034 [Salpingoeca rosetta]EGD80097.1 hypothetical protein PTSG_13034 [Salpingoeca rosetta]|eukprot:XP_004988422.1 hypothetical protein PTSG_13034 [Salpingoeca rosetta]